MIKISNLAKSNINELQKMNQNIANKRKHYRCICYGHNISLKGSNVIKTLTTPFDIYQKTPIRVLHRRVALTRKRTIYQLKFKVINSHYFMLDLITESGTYIKEFIHGDKGRTLPNLSTFFGKCSILQLDVLNLVD